MSKTRIVIMAMVIKRFVAILYLPLAIPPTSKKTLKGPVPTSHAPQRLDAPVDIALALEQHVSRVLDLVALPVQIGQGARPDLLGVVGERLAVLEPLRRAVESVRPREEL